MRSTWSGGQYSLLRATFGLALSVAFALQAGPAWLRVSGVVAALVFALGAFAPIAAIAAAALWLSLAAWSEDAGLRAYVAAPWSALVPVALIVHAALPRAPFGSLAARGRVDPRGGWHFPAWTKWCAWGLVLLLALAAEFQGDADANALPHARVVACAAGLVPHLRPFAWLVLVGEEAVSNFDPAFAHLLVARLLALGILFDPAWIPGRAGPVEHVYYDGSCGLCHRAVRFLLSEDGDGTRFRFAPLDGDAFRAEVGADARAALPDTVVVRRGDGTLLVRSDAALHLLERMGGAWRVLGTLGGFVPRAIRDAAYDAVARVRRRVFAAPTEACPLLPADLRARFQA